MGYLFSGGSDDSSVLLLVGSDDVSVLNRRQFCWRSVLTESNPPTGTD
jgi:hypothetical protein